MKECIQALKVQQNPAKPSAEEDVLGNFIAEKLKCMSQRKKMIAEKRVTDIIFEREMQDETQPSDFYRNSPHVSQSSFYPTGSASMGSLPPPSSDQYYY